MLQAEQKVQTKPYESKAARYLSCLLRAHETWYNVQENYQYAGRIFDGYAEFHSHGEQYVLVKRAKLWEVNSHEYLFFLLRDTVDTSDITELISFMKTEALKKVELVPNHMSSAITLVVITNQADEDAKSILRKTTFRKNYSFGIRGWANLRLALVELQQHDITTNSAAKEMKKTLAQNLSLVNAE